MVDVRLTLQPDAKHASQVKAERYCGPIFILRNRPTGTVMAPELAAADRACRFAATGSGRWQV